MFPFDIEDEELDALIEDEKEPADYEINFETRQLTGRIITGVKAIEQWVKIVLLTDRYIFPQYSWNHGSDLYTLIGQNYNKEYVNTEVRRMLSEAMSVDPSITGFEDLVISMNDETMTISFVINTIYGRGEVNV